MGVLDDTKQKMQQAMEHFKHELKGLRSGRANPAILDVVDVEIYGSLTKLKSIATVSSPEPRLLQITPFDPANSVAISKGIEKANLNLQPVIEKNVIRIKIPPMDTAMRQEIVKQAKRKGEESKVGVRGVRRDMNELAKKQKADGSLTEDGQKKLEKQIQELTDKFCKEIDELVVAKEKDIMEV